MLKRILVGVVAIVATIGTGDGRAGATGASPRVVTFSPALTRIVFDMGLGDHVVGVTRLCRLPPGEDRPRVGDAFGVNAEAVLSVRPDLLLVQSSSLARFQGIRQIDPHVRIEGFVIETLADLQDAIARIGRLLGREDLSRRALERFRRKLREVSRQVAGRPRPRVLFVMGTDRPAVAGKETFIHEMIELAGGVDAAEDIPGRARYRQTHIDAIVAAAPEVLICQVSAPSRAEAARKYWLRWEQLPAARQGRVFVVSDPDWSIPSTRTADLVETLAEMIHAAPTPRPDGIGYRLWKARAVRLLAAATVGAALAVAGMALQGLLRNPLAESYVLGISSGAGVGVLLGLAAAGWTRMPEWATTPTLAFVGALLTSAVVYGIAQRRGRLDPYSLILSGVIVNAFNAAVMLTIYLYVDPYRIADFARWGMGQIPDTVDLTVLATCAGCVVFGWGFVFFRGAAFNALSLGDDVAASIGVAVHRLRVETFAVAALMTAGAVALAGPIAFVGLIVPHACRMLFGPDHRRLALLSGAMGAVFLVLAETLCRSAGPWIGVSIVPVGILTALAGGPFFIYLLRRRFKEVSA